MNEEAVKNSNSLQTVLSTLKNEVLMPIVTYKLQSKLMESRESQIRRNTDDAYNGSGPVNPYDAQRNADKGFINRYYADPFVTGNAEIADSSNPNTGTNYVFAAGFLVVILLFGILFIRK